MKIAVCLSGQPRHFNIGHKYLSESLSNHEVDYFFHLRFDESNIGEELKISIRHGKLLKIQILKDYGWINFKC